MKILDIQVEVNPEAINAKVNNLLDKKTMLEIHNLFAQMCDKYVPRLEGPLSQSVFANVTDQKISYGGGSSNVPYARYQYYLHDMHEDLAGKTNRTREAHPLATSYWDKALMLLEGDSFKKRVEEILRKRAKELYG